jgi:hypothetical protein
MKYSKSLMTGLIGLALLAAPIAAVAQDNNSRKDNSRQSQAQSQSRHDTSASHSYSAPARSNTSTRESAPRTATRDESRDQHASTREARPANVTRNESGNRGARTNNGASDVTATTTRNESRHQRSARTDNAASGMTVERNSGGSRNEATRSYGSRNHEGSGDSRDYGNRGYDHDRDYAAGSSYYVMPRGYRGGACAWARHLRIVYAQDRNSGHPAAASDLLPQMHNAERRCGGVPYGYNSYRY